MVFGAVVRVWGMKLSAYQETSRDPRKCAHDNGVLEVRTKALDFRSFFPVRSWPKPKTSPQYIPYNP